jgi:site-specific DNA-methyltransferase (adenine-specific)
VSVHKGRFPANLIHDGSEEVLECFPITGKSSGGSGKATTDKCGYKNNGIQFDGYKKGYEAEGLGGYGDSDSAAIYFKTCPILDEDIEIQRLFYTAKASKKERNEGIESFEDKIGGSLLGTADKSLLNGSGNVRNNLMRNNHPTVKPLKLMEYLVGLVTMPENTLILDPFMGSGTTGIACKNKDVDFIGIELNEDYFKIAEERIKKG